jgi:hypothetical protein
MGILDTDSDSDNFTDITVDTDYDILTDITEATDSDKNTDRGERGHKGHVKDRTEAFTGIGDDELVEKILECSQCK